MFQPRRFHVFWFFIAAMVLLLALGICLLVIGFTTPPFAAPGSWHM